LRNSSLVAGDPAQIFDFSGKRLPLNWISSDIIVQDYNERGMGN